MHTQQFKNSTGKFPISTESLQILQDNLQLLQRGLRAIAAGNNTNVIILQSTATSDGLLFYGGELMPLKGEMGSNYYITIHTTNMNVTANGQTFSAIRTDKYAYWSTDGIPRAAFRVLVDDYGTLANVGSKLSSADSKNTKQDGRLDTLEKALTNMAGIVVDWKDTDAGAGAVKMYTMSMFPDGFVPCSSYVSTNADAEVAAWKERYNSIEVTFSGTSSNKSVTIKSVNGRTVPSLKAIDGCDFKLMKAE